MSDDIIHPRTKSEREAYLQGFAAGVKARHVHGLEFCKNQVRIMAQVEGVELDEPGGDDARPQAEAR